MPLCLAWLALAASAADAAEPAHHAHQYCVVGAGPGGIQLGYFFKKAQRWGWLGARAAGISNMQGAVEPPSGRDFVLLERGTVPGSFYERFPRSRTLISINKARTPPRCHSERNDDAFMWQRFTANKDPDFNASIAKKGR